MFSGRAHHLPSLSQLDGHLRNDRSDVAGRTGIASPGELFEVSSDTFFATRSAQISRSLIGDVVGHTVSISLALMITPSTVAWSWAVFFMMCRTPAFPALATTNVSALSSSHAPVAQLDRAAVS